MTDTPGHDPKRERRPLSIRDPTGDPTKCGHYGHRRKGDGQPCVGSVVTGTTSCRMHGGQPGPVLRARGEIVQDLRGWGLGDTTVDPGEVYLMLITQAAQRVQRYSGLLAEAYEAAEQLRQAHEAQELVLGPPEERVGYRPDGSEYDRPEPPAVQAARLALQRIFGSGGVSALVGHTYDATKDGELYATQEAIRALVKLEMDERRFLADMCTKAVAAGLAKRRVDLAARAVDAGAQVAYVLIGVDDETLR